MLPPDDLGRLITAVRNHFGLAPDAEVTTESNPESIDSAGLHRLRELGFNRISFGMQSAVPHVLATLDRTHSPGRPLQAVAEAKAAGFANISLDLIYGTPGESASDWLESLMRRYQRHRAHQRLRADRGGGYPAGGSDPARRAPPTDDDDLADKYLIADDRLTAAGHTAYEVSNWSTSAATRCRHNLGYWRSHHWWGIGPGAHSHVGGVRWWNVKHPQAYASRLASGSRRLRPENCSLRSNGGSSASCSSFASLTASPPRCSPVPSRVVLLIFWRGAGSGRGWHVDLDPQGRLLADGVIRDLLD